MNPADIDNEIVEDDVRTKFSMVPYCVCSMKGMTPSAYLLYGLYKMICGESGACWASDATLSQIAESLSVSTIVRSRKKLLALGLIRSRRIEKKSGGFCLRITVVNIWRHNEQQESPLKTKAPTPPPALRQIDVVPKPLCQIDTVRDVNLTQCTTSNCHTIKNTENNTPKKKNTLSPGGDAVREFPSSGGFIGEDRPQKKDYPVQAAKKLYGRLAAKRKIMRPPNLAKWAAEFRAFLASGQVQRPRFHEVLKWYLMNIGEPFVPQAFGAAAFVQKFIRIEEAMSRMSRPIDERSMTVDQQIELVHKRVRSEPVEVFQRASWKDRLARTAGEGNG
jgi:hypothetical protein